MKRRDRMYMSDGNVSSGKVSLAGKGPAVDIFMEQSLTRVERMYTRRYVATIWRAGERQRNILLIGVGRSQVTPVKINSPRPTAGYLHRKPDSQR